jgi:hypothetical protein
MRGIFSVVALLLLGVLLALPRPAYACPMCAEGVPNDSPEEVDPARLSRAYNNSIYLMVGMPYLLLGVVGFMVYRGLRQRALAQSPAQPHPPANDTGSGPTPDGTGVPSCSPPSPGATS